MSETVKISTLSSDAKFDAYVAHEINVKTAMQDTEKDVVEARNDETFKIFSMI